MPRCIVCRGQYSATAPRNICSRCGTSNARWEEWQEEERQRGMIRDIVQFLKPVLYSPLWAPPLIGWLLGLVAGWVLLRELLVLWAVAAAGLVVLASLFAVISGYADRFNWHWGRVTRGGMGESLAYGSSSMWHSARRLAQGVILVFLLLIASLQLVREGGVLNSWLRRLPDGSSQMLAAAISLLVVAAYARLIWNLAWLPMQAALQHYSDGLTDVAPEPIFLQPLRLERLVREEVAHALGYAPSEMKWGEMERMSQLGIRLRIHRELPSTELEDLKGQITTIPNTREYEVTADQWGRVQSIREL